MEYKNEFDTAGRVSIKEIKTFLEIQRNESESCNSIDKKHQQHHESKTKNVPNSTRQVFRFISKKAVLTLLLVTMSSSFVVLYLGDSLLFDDNKYKGQPMTSDKYVIENLRGDTVSTWKSWNVPEGTTLTVNIVNADDFSQEKLDAVKDAILSEKTINIDDSWLHEGPAGTSSTYYLGWQGALERVSEHKTELYVPVKFSIIESPHGQGDILIALSTIQDTDGYSGYTKSITDGHQILKSSITIYSVNELTTGQLTAITRHEFGHALGLGHSSDPVDLMHATIQTEYPYISDCDIGAVTALYNGEGTSEVQCEK